MKRHARPRPKQIVALDVETTGLDPVFDRVVEVAGVRFDAQGRVLDRYVTLVHPERNIPPAVTRIHGLTDADVADAPHPAEVWPRFVEWLGPPNQHILIAHNAGFDSGFIGRALAREGLDRGDEAVVDTVPLARRRWPRLANHRLGTIAEWLCLHTIPGHRALGDAECLREIWLALGEIAFATEEWFVYPLAAPVRPVAVPRGLEAVADALAQGRDIRFVYDGGTQGLEPRDARPRELVVRAGVTYLLAVCRRDGIEKAFRVERIKRAELVALPRPARQGTFL